MCCGGWIRLRSALPKITSGRMVRRLLHTLQTSCSSKIRVVAKLVSPLTPSTVQAQQDESYRVHTLYAPPDGVEHTAVVILFHGICRSNKEWEATWMTRGPPQSQVCWPKAWLPKLFGGSVVVLAPAYDASPRGVNDDVKEIGHNLRMSLIRCVLNVASRSRQHDHTMLDI
jgi:hypothetical protein